MKTTAVRMHGKKDLRLEEFELPEISPDELLVEIISDSICMSTYKEALQGDAHKRVPDNIAAHPVIIGHETAGNILKVGENLTNHYKAGDKFALQPALHYKGKPYTIGYGYEYCGGSATYAVMPAEVMKTGSLLPYKGEAYYEASLAEPMSCIIGAFHASYHTLPGSYEHKMGIKEGGKLIILAGAGPMGMGAIDYALHSDHTPGLLVITDINEERLQRAASIFSTAEAAKQGVTLQFINTADLADPVAFLRELTGNTGYDDAFVFAPVPGVIEQADKILAYDGCLNFFSGPVDTELSAKVNFYNIHYNAAHMMGTSGGYTSDMLESLSLCEQKRINPAVMITHICGLDSVVDTVLNLPNISGGKKLCYPKIQMELTAIDDFAEKGKTNLHFAALDQICKQNKGLWCLEAEQYLLKHWGK